jgi:TM2 domain-containing membrane protein YozV
MSTPPGESPARPPEWRQPQPYGYPNPIGPPPSGDPVYPAQPYGYPAYPGPGYGIDPEAPYGRDPATGKPLSDKSVVAAGCLQLFFGIFGVGRFYIGSTAIGGVQLALTLLGLVLTIGFVGFFILFGVGVWAFIDALMMFTGTVTDAHGRKLR